MSEQTSRTIEDILRRLDHLESLTEIIYQKSTYTPTYLGSATPGTTTYTTQAGFYTRIGRVVFFNGRVTWTAATGTGNAQVSLPFTTANVTNMRYAISIWTDNVTFANQGVMAIIAPNSSIFLMYSPLTNAASALVGMEAAGDIIFSGWFNLS